MIPPLIGFFGKQMILSAALQSGYIFLALIAVITSVISAVYYLNIIKTMFFEDKPYKLNIINSNINAFNLNFCLSGALTSIISFFTLSIILFIFTPNQLLHWSNLLAIIFFIS